MNTLKLQPKYMLVERQNGDFTEHFRTVIWLDDDFKLLYDKYNWTLSKRDNHNDTNYNALLSSNVFDDVMAEYLKLKNTV